MRKCSRSISGILDTRKSKSLAFLICISLIGCLQSDFIPGSASLCKADSWLGTVETDGGITKIQNPDMPANGLVDYYPDEIWRIDGTDEDTVFGLIYGAAADSSGNIYLLDIQLKDVLKVDLHGQIVNHIGREGEGPGEFVRPVALFVDDRDQLGVMQNIPRRIELFSPTGEVLGNHPLPEYGNSSRPILRGVQSMLGRLYLVLLSRDIDEEGNSLDNNALVSVSSTGGDLRIFDERKLFRALDNGHFIEQEMSRVSPWKWSVGSDGKVFSNKSFSEYKIWVHNADGDLEKIISRKYQTLQRPDWHFRELQESNDKKFEGRFIRNTPITYEASPTDPDIEELFAREDGTLWVLSSRGAYDKPHGVLGVFDVFDGDGRFDHQARVFGEGDYFFDYFYFSRGYLIVVKNVLLDQTQADEISGKQDLKYEVICYRF